MTNDVPDRVWVYASNIETWRGVGEWTDDAEPDCSDEWPHAPFLHATPARLHAEELVEALREIIAKATWENYPTALELMAVIDSLEDIAVAALAHIEQEKP